MFKKIIEITSNKGYKYILSTLIYDKYGDLKDIDYNPINYDTDFELLNNNKEAKRTVCDINSLRLNFKDKTNLCSKLKIRTYFVYQLAIYIYPFAYLAKYFLLLTSFIAIFFLLK